MPLQDQTTLEFIQSRILELLEEVDELLAIAERVKGRLQGKVVGESKERNLARP